MSVEIECKGVVTISWRAYGVLRRAQRCGGLMMLPTGQESLVGEGLAFTRWGARRKAERALRRWT